MTSMRRMFYSYKENEGGLQYFNSNISHWNVSNVTDMSVMFYYGSFNQDISNWDVSKVTDHTEFSDTSSLEDKNLPKFP